jgi:hypothetical protein
MRDPSRCCSCRRWFDLRGAIVPQPASLPAAISDGLCLDCYIEQTAPFRPTSLAGWADWPRTTAQDIFNQFAALSSPGTSTAPIGHSGRFSHNSTGGFLALDFAA